jgi:pimeloyl-ACP methyl ester carboxylesterase
MMRRGVVIGAFLLCCGALLAGSIVTPAAKAEASLKFYQSAPAGWKTKPVGTLLKWQREGHSWPALSGLKGFRVMYVSRGALGDKVFETGMVYLPTAERVPRGGRPVMAWDHGTSGVGDSAAPSRYPWLYPEPVTTPWDWYAQWVGKLGRMGYVVACPDYEGLGTPGLHTYCHAASQGRATIDAVRAAKQLAAKLDVATSKRWGVAGHSQGGQAALAAAELAATAYGKGLSLKATVAVAPAVEIATINGMSAADAIGWPYVGYTAWGIRALSPDFDFTKFCGPWVLDVVEQAPDNYYDDWWGLCLGAHWVGEYPDGSPGVPTASDTLASGWESDPDVAAYLKATEVGNAKAAGAVLALQGTDDEFIATFDTLIAKLEAQGDDLQYVILPDQRHDYALQFGWPWAKAFLEDRLPAR